jgi:hypothetical protein
VKIQLLFFLFSIFPSNLRVFHESKNKILIVDFLPAKRKESVKEFRLIQKKKAIERLLPLKKTSSSIQLTNIWRQSERVLKQVFG